MQLSEGERLILVMLADITKALGLNGSVDPDLVRRLVSGGDCWALKRLYPSIFSDPGPSDVVVAETGNILWMWHVIETSLDRLPRAQREQTERWTWTRFKGFDTSDEAHLRIASTMVNDLGELSRFRGRALHCSVPGSLSRYRAMYAQFTHHAQAEPSSVLSFDALHDLCS